MSSVSTLMAKIVASFTLTGSNGDGSSSAQTGGSGNYDDDDRIWLIAVGHSALNIEYV